MLSNTFSVYPEDERSAITNISIESICFKEHFSILMPTHRKRLFFQKKGLDLFPTPTSVLGYTKPCFKNVNKLKEQYPDHHVGIDIFISNIKYLSLSFFEEKLKESTFKFNSFILDREYSIIKPLCSHEAWVADKASNYIESAPTSALFVEDLDGLISTILALMNERTTPVFFEDWVFDPILLINLLETIGSNLKNLESQSKKEFILIAPFLTQESLHEFNQLKNQLKEKYNIDFHLFYADLSLKSLLTQIKENSDLDEFLKMFNFSSEILKFTSVVYSDWRSNLTEQLPAILKNIVKDRTPYYLESPLHSAILSRNDQIVQHLTENGIDLDTTDSNLRTPLHLAVLQNEPIYVRNLLENGGYIDAEDINGKKAIDLAIESSSFLICDILIEFGANPSVFISNKDLLNKIILRCAYNKYIYLLNFLIDDSVNLNKITSAQGDNLIKILLNHRDTAVFFKKIILLNNFKFIKQFIIDSPYKKFIDQHQCLMLIAQYGTPWMLELALSRYPRSLRLFSNNYKIHHFADQDGNTVLHHAALQQNHALLCYLQKKYFVNFQLTLNHQDEYALNIIQDSDDSLLHLLPQNKTKPILFKERLLDFFNNSHIKSCSLMNKNSSIHPYNGSGFN